MPSAPASVSTQTRASIASPPVIGVTTSGFGGASEPFIDYLIKHSSVPLSRFFKKPECASPSPHAALNDQPPRVSYRHLPHELSRSALLETAGKYYEENKTRRDLSIRVVKALVLFFLLPACIVFLLRSAYLRFSTVRSPICHLNRIMRHVPSGREIWISCWYSAIVGAVFCICSPGDMAMFAVARSHPAPCSSIHFFQVQAVLREQYSQVVLQSSPMTGYVSISAPRAAYLTSRTSSSWKAEIEAKGYEVLERVKDEMKSVKQLVRCFSIQGVLMWRRHHDRSQYLNAVHQRRNALKALSQHVAKNKSVCNSNGNRFPFLR